MKPVWDIVRDTAELTAEAWKTLPHKSLLSKNVHDVIDRQIRKVATKTGRNSPG
jgi:hypothetical protein